MVIFGVTGDLGHRKLLPALYNLAPEGALPDRFNLIGFAHRERDPDDWRDQAREAIQEHSRQEPKDDVLDALIERFSFLWGGFDDDAAFKNLDKLLDELDDEGDEPLNRLFYLATSPSFFGPIAERLGEFGMAHGEGDAEVRIVVEKPIGHDLELGQGAQRDAAEGLRGAADLPHRPLPRQGDRAEHARVPLRERDVRAGLEPQLRRPRADHRGRGPRRRQPRGLLRRLGRAARPGPEPHAPAPGAAGDGAAAVVLGRLGARREGEGARAPSGRPRSRTSSEHGRPRAVRGGRASTARRSPATSRRRASPEDSTTETYVGAAPRDRQLALGRRAVLPAHGQAPRAQGHRDRAAAAARSPISPSPSTARSARSPTSSSSRSSPTRASRSRSGRRSPAPGCACGR